MKYIIKASKDKNAKIQFTVHLLQIMYNYAWYAISVQINITSGINQTDIAGNLPIHFTTEVSEEEDFKDFIELLKET